MGRRNADGLEELGHEMETVLGDVKELAILCNLILSTSAPENTKEGAGTNLL